MITKDDSYNVVSCNLCVKWSGCVGGVEAGENCAENAEGQKLDSTQASSAILSSISCVNLPNLAGAISG